MRPAQAVVLEADVIDALRRAVAISGRTISEEVRAALAALDTRPQRALLTTRQAAEHLGYSDATHEDPVRAFRAFARRHQLPCRVSGRRVLWRTADLEAALSRPPRVEGNSYVL